MNPQEFVNGIVKRAIDHTVRDVMEDLADPPGRKPWREKLELSRWFLALSAADREMIAKIVRMAAHHATFSILNVLDGSGRIEGEIPDGRFELRYVDGDVSTLLNDRDGDFLHDLLPQLWTR